MAEYKKSDYKQKENTCNLFENGFKTTKQQPDMTGTVVMSKDLLKEMVERVKEGKEAKLSFSLWKNVSLKGNNYQTVVMKAYTPPKNDSGDIEVPF